MAFRSGIVALIGKPNVGKSTLVNALVGQKVSIVSSKPQTTRRRVLGYLQGETFQLGLIDTPGIHEPHTRLGRAMVDAARSALFDVDLILVVVDGGKAPDEEDKQLAKVVREAAGKTPVLLCVNKMDHLAAEHVVARTERFQELYGAKDFMLTVATKSTNLDKLLDLILENTPEGEPLFPADEFTDQSSRFLVAEIIREKVLDGTRQEVPFATAVRIDAWNDTEGKTEISAVLMVEKQGQKAILIGDKGQMIKNLGTLARSEIESLLERSVHLDLHVIVRENWRGNLGLLRELEYSD